MKLKFANALSLALILAMLFTSIGLADNTVADGDGVAQVTNQDMSFGNVCAGTTTTKSALIVINRNGSGTNVFKNSSTVTVSVLSVTGAGLSASIDSPDTITLPSNWSTIGNNIVSNAVSSTVTLVAGSAGTFSGKVTYRGVGVNSSNATINRDDEMNVTATIVNCDSTPPTLNLPGSITVEATGSLGAVVAYTATASDTNPLNPTVTCSLASGSTFALGTTTVNCSASDATGNTANGSFSVNVEDTTAPVVTPPSNITVEAVDANGAIVSYSAASASDLVSGSLPASCLPASGSTFPLGLNTVTCSATDGAGNTGSNTFTINVQDTLAPILAVPGDLTEEATGPNGAAVSFAVSASDAVHGAVTPSCNPDSGSTFPLGSTAISCSATDNAGNTSTSGFNVNIVDTTAPSLDLQDSFTVEAEAPAGAVATFLNSASDIVDGSVAVVCDANSGDVFPLGPNTINCSATDNAGNTAYESFEITVQDTTPPSINIPADQLLEATGPGGAVAIFSATASDLVDGDLQVSCDADSGDTFPLGTTTVHCSVSDAAGNEASGSFIIIVEDTTAPEIAPHADVTAEATSAAGATVNYTSPGTSDAVDGAGMANCSPATGSQFDLGSTTITCNASDQAGNAAVPTSFIVHVVDTTAPSLTLPSNIIAEATGSLGADVSYVVTADDLVSGAVAVICSPASGSTFGFGSTSVSCSATDGVGNTANGGFSVLVQDTTAPILTVPDDITAEATGASGAQVTYSASASDVVDGAVTPVCSPNSGSTFPIASTTVTCSASDSHGNSVGDSFTVTVQDTTAPSLTVPSNITAEATDPSGAAVSFSASALDVVDGAITPSCLPTSGSIFPLGATTVNCSATDAHGNNASESFSVTVVDTTKPTLSLPANMTVSATSAAGAAVTFSASATDIVDSSVAVTCGPASGSTFAPGTTSVNCSATDAHGNTASGSFTVLVQFRLAGFYQPVDMTTGSTIVWNTVRNGSTVPLKFEIFAGSTELTAPSLVNQPLRAVGVACGTGTADDIELTATGGTSLRYDTTGGQFIYNWQTPRIAGACYKVTVTTTDGSSIFAYFKLK